jgi:hypothetical protein
VADKRVNRPLLKKPKSKSQGRSKKPVERIEIAKFDKKKKNYGNRMREVVDEVFEELVKIRNPGNSKEFAEVYPIEIIGRYFIYLENGSGSTFSQVTVSCYCVAHLEKGITIWSAFLGLSHAQDFAEWMDNVIKDNFMHHINFTKIRNRLVFMGYRPLTKR